MDNLFNRLVENALDFLKTSVEELKQRPKYSVIHFYAALELLLKARLMAEHWSLVVTQKTQPDRDKFIAGDFQSVNLREAASRLEKVLKSGLSNHEFRTFSSVANHRNRLIHFFHEADPTNPDEKLIQEIAKQQLSAWYLLHKLLTVKWRDSFVEWLDRINDADRVLRKHHEFLEVVFDHLFDEIQKKQDSGVEFRACPSCDFESLEIDELTNEIYFGSCLVCELAERYVRVECPTCGSERELTNDGFGGCYNCKSTFEPDDLVDLLTDHAAAHVAARDGDDSWDAGNCSLCDSYHTVIRVEDWHFCAGCFGKFEYLQKCEWCGEWNTGDMRGSFATGCNCCDGSPSWDAP